MATRAAPERTSAADFLPRSRSLAALRKAAQACEGCELFRHATQTVFGQGAKKARLMLVGEIPGDQEDLQGKPFVGPAGKLLDAALEEASISRTDVYLTNAVKHFKWEPRGKRRLHKKPGAREIAACRPWLEAEMETVQPTLIVCLGATAAQSLLGRDFRITKQRGIVQTGNNGVPILATHHPSAVLRAPKSEDRARLRAELVDDLRAAREASGG